MFDPVEIHELMAEEIEAITIMCRARKRIQAPEIHDEDFNETLNIMAGQEPELEESFVQQLNAADPSGQLHANLYALVRNGKLKTTKGGGKEAKARREVFANASSASPQIISRQHAQCEQQELQTVAQKDSTSRTWR